jgi:hypothetical protein
VPAELLKYWNEKTNAALKLVNKVEQPLKEYLKQKSIFLPLDGKTINNQIT